MKLSLKAARINEGISQLELAGRLGVSSSTLSRWEIGELPIPDDKLDMLCEVCHISRENIKVNTERKVI